MSRRLEYSSAAQDDLTQIAGYIAQRSGQLNVGLTYTKHLRGRCKELATSPFVLGQERAECGEGLRSIPEGNYVIFFRADDQVLRVVAILEGHLDVGPIVTTRP